MAQPLDLFPPIEPLRTGMLQVDDIHTLYWEECGNPKGKPVVFLHGGPGGGLSPKHRRFFDPAAYRIILFDQRGCGNSLPFGETRANTTTHLIADIEKLRELLSIERWQVFGGSWGSTLALAYAQTYPERVTELVLRGIFLFRQWEIDWFLKGAAAIFPDENAKFLGYLPPEHRANPLPHYYKLLTDPDPAVHMAAGKVWTGYETACSTLLPPADSEPDPAKDLTMARMEAHYFTHSLFKPDDKLLRDIGRIRHIPAVIVQGRYDIVCPAKSAFDLHAAWPEAEFIVVPDAGHSAMEAPIRRALVAATEQLKQFSE